jgi:Ser/Thr protein kinase RdoA (MazF antagonist)
VPWNGSGLAVEDHRSFLSTHEARLDDLAAALGSDLRQGLPAVPASYPDAPLVSTHGDPGPGNYLDDGNSGTLIDWEDARVAPRGLDLGRAAFIALLGSGPEGYVAEDQAERARSLVDGYLAATDDWSAGADELAWWPSVAGVQFAQRRLERAGEPGALPWRDPSPSSTLRSPVSGAPDGYLAVPRPRVPAAFHRPFSGPRLGSNDQPSSARRWR